MKEKIDEFINKIRDSLGNDLAHEADCFEACLKSNLSIMAEKEEDGSYFLITGDIPAMWLRDSACQMTPYLQLLEDVPELGELIEGVIKKQMACINLDPYANAFLQTKEDKSIWVSDETQMLPGVWERKYEIDSLCFPMKLALDYWEKTGKDEIFDGTFLEAAHKMVNVFATEQYHEEKSFYRFQRKDCPYIDSLSRDGKGALVKSGCGLIWSGFRPSDDGCVYGYLIPSNMLAVVVLEGLSKVASQVWEDRAFANELASMAAEVREAIETYAVVPTGSDRFDKPYYAYEVDGYGQYLIQDDANFPNLMSAPYFGYCEADSPLWMETMRRMWSQENPYYYEGCATKGIGSIHTKRDYIWPLSLGMRGLVSDTKEEKLAMIKSMAALDDGTNLMHESVYIDDPHAYTRPLFGWANAVYCQLVLDFLS